MTLSGKHEVPKIEKHPAGKKEIRRIEKHHRDERAEEFP